MINIYDTTYEFEGANDLISPSLIYYKDIIQENIRKTIAMAGTPGRLWPHVKSHKMEQVVRLQLKAGITRFKCSTIAEAEMAAASGAASVLLAYPPVGPNMIRYFRLVTAFPTVDFLTIGDNREQIHRLGELFYKNNLKARILADINPGMNRTGISFEETAHFFKDCHAMPGISMEGLHCYDGHRTEQDFSERCRQTEDVKYQISRLAALLGKDKFCFKTLILGGSPSMPCYTDYALPGISIYLSPGTILINDYGYSHKYPDLDFRPGAAILTRVISRPAKGYFTLDLGYKAVAADPPGARGVIVSLPHARELFQNEEHWTFVMEEGYEHLCPQIGDTLFVIPAHICPTSALYPFVPVV